MAAESKLLITIDSRKAKTELDAVNQALDGLEKKGNTTAKSASDTGKAINSVGKEASTAATGLTTLSTSIASFGNGLRGTTPALGAAVTGITGVTAAAVGSLGALTGMAMAYAQNAAEIQNFANVAGVGVVEFQRMSIAAQQVGVTSEQLSDQMKDFNEKLGEFVLTGGGEAKDAFETLQKETKMSGEEIKNFALEMQKASTGEAMQMYINKLDEAGVSQEQMSFLVENMANDMTKLLPIFADNGAAIDAWGAAAERAGAIMDESAIAKAQELATMTSLLKLQLTGLTNTVMAAVVPALVDIADAFFQDSQQGNYFSQIGNLLANGLRTLATVAVGVATAFNVVGKAIGGAAAAMMAFVSGNFSDAANIVKATFNDAVDSATQAAKTVGKIWTGGTAQSIKGLTIPQPKAPSNRGGNGITAGLDDFIKGEDKKTKKAKSAGQQRNRDAEQLAKERDRIEYEYANAEEQRRIKLNEEIARLQKAGMTQYIDDAKNQYAEEEKLIKMKYEFDLVEHRLNEETKLQYSYNIKEQEIIADKKLTEEQRKQKQQMLRDNYNLEMSLMQLEKNKRMADATEYRDSELSRIKFQYEYERQQILLNQKLSKEEKAQLTNESYRAEDRAVNEGRRQAELNYQSTVLGQDTAPQEEAAKRAEAIEAALQWELITREEYNKKMLENDRLFYFAKAQLTLDSAQQVMGTMTGLFGDLLGEQSSAYAAMFAVEKAFAVAKAMMAIPESYSQAYNAVVGTPVIGPYIAPVMGAAAAAAQVAQAAMIKSANFTGYKTGGYTGNYGVNDVAGVVHGKEYVLNAQATKRIGVDTLNAVNNGASLQAENSKQKIDNNVKVVMVRDEDEAKDMLYSADGEKAFLYHMKRNRGKI